MPECCKLLETTTYVDLFKGFPYHVCPMMFVVEIRICFIAHIFQFQLAANVAKVLYAIIRFEQSYT